MAKLESRKESLISELKQSGLLSDPKVEAAFRAVRREDFVPASMKEHAYDNAPLPIGFSQTISQPYTVVFMTEALDARPEHVVLEVGTGSGYQAALLSKLCRKVVTVERIPELYKIAKARLSGRDVAKRNVAKGDSSFQRPCYPNVSVFCGDASEGWPKERRNIPLRELPSYDRIIVTASASEFPEKLFACLREGGRLVVPVGNEMILATKKHEKAEKSFLGYFSFVPLRKSCQ